MNKRSTKFYRKNEREVMDKLGLKPTKNSGAGWIEKSDGQNDYIIAELKSTDHASMKVNLKDIQILEHHAAVAHKIPMFVIQFLQTNEVFIMLKPEDLSCAAEYLNTGKCEVNKVEITNFETLKPYVPKHKIVKSNPDSRSDFWDEREETFKNGKRIR